MAFVFLRSLKIEEMNRLAIARNVSHALRNYTQESTRENVRAFSNSRGNGIQDCEDSQARGRWEGSVELAERETGPTRENFHANYPRSFRGFSPVSPFSCPGAVACLPLVALVGWPREPTATRQIHFVFIKFHKASRPDNGCTFHFLVRGAKEEQALCRGKWRTLQDEYRLSLSLCLSLFISRRILCYSLQFRLQLSRCRASRSPLLLVLRVVVFKSSCLAQRNGFDHAPMDRVGPSSRRSWTWCS